MGQEEGRHEHRDQEGESTRQGVLVDDDDLHLRPVGAGAGIPEVSEEEAVQHPLATVHQKLSELPLTPGEVTVLATYNSERGRGLIHTAKWMAQMARLQARFDAQPHPADESPKRRRWRR